MANLVAEYWDIDGTSLHTLGIFLRTLGGDLTGGVEMRGDDVTVPYRPGALWERKAPSTRILTLEVTVTDRRPDDTLDSSIALRKARFHANLQAARRLLWRDDGSQFALTKRWYQADFTDSSPAATLVSATAMAAFSSGMEPEGSDPLACTFTVELVIADPYFFGPAVSFTAAGGASIAVDNPGDASVVGAGAVLTFHGPLANPVATLAGNTLGVGATISAGDSVVVDLDNWSVLRTSDDANLIGTLTRSGTRALLPIPMGTSTLACSAAGAGHVTLSFKPPYL